MTQGVKSKYFGCYWQSMFLTAITFPGKCNPRLKEHRRKLRQFKQFYVSLRHVLPCRFCREFISDVLSKMYPLDFSGRIPLMRSIYVWKDQVNQKLISQGCKVTQPSPPFEVVLKRYNKLRANCNKNIGKCV